MELRKGELEEERQWVEYWITDEEGEETWIGSLRFPVGRTGKAVFHAGCYTAIEVYGGFVRPSEIPAWSVTFKGMAMDGQAAELEKACYPANVGTLRNARFELADGGQAVRYEIGLDHMAHELEREDIC